MNINKTRKLEEKKFFNDSYQTREKKLENYFHNMFTCFKNTKNSEKKKQLKSMLISNIINYKKNTKTHNKKSIIKKSMESSINLSKNNFCGSFLVPDYIFVSGAQILKELKSKGAEKTITKHFSKEIPKVNFIKNNNSFKTCSATRNKGPYLKSKYFDLINSNISRINKITSFNRSKTTKCPNRLKYHDKYNKSFLNFFNGDNLKAKKKKNNYFNFNNDSDKFFKNIGNNINNLSKNSYFSSLNNSKTYLSSSTTCSSKTIKFLKYN